MDWMVLINFCMLSLGIAAIVYVFRTVIEFILDNPKVPASKTSKFWKELFLPISPILTGVFIGVFAKKYPYMQGFDSTSARIIFGMCAGLFSGVSFRIAKAFLISKVNAEKNDSPSKEVVDLNISKKEVKEENK